MVVAFRVEWRSLRLQHEGAALTDGGGADLENEVIDWRIVANQSRVFHAGHLLEGQQVDLNGIIIAGDRDLQFRLCALRLDDGPNVQEG